MAWAGGVGQAEAADGLCEAQIRESAQARPACGRKAKPTADRTDERAWPATFLSCSALADSAAWPPAAVPSVKYTVAGIPSAPLGLAKALGENSLRARFHRGKRDKLRDPSDEGGVGLL